MTHQIVTQLVEALSAWSDEMQGAPISSIGLSYDSVDDASAFVSAAVAGVAIVEFY